MDITEIRVKLMHNRTDRLRAFCSITIDDDFVVHDLRVIEGRKGLFVAMPSRKLTDNCPRCGAKNELRSKFCADCGQKLGEKRVPSGAGRDKLHVDVAHPINTPCRELLQEKVLAAYQEEEERADSGEEPHDDHEPDQAADFGGEYGDFDEDAPDADVGGDQRPVEEEVDVPELEAVLEADLQGDAGHVLDDLAPVTEPAPEAPPVPPAEEPPAELGEVTAEGAVVLPSEAPDEVGPEESEEEAGDLPDGAAGPRRRRGTGRARGGFGEGIL